MRPVLAVLALGLATGHAAAQALTDPTRPPNVQDMAGDAAGGSSGPVLQSVLIATDRRYAVIDGRRLQLGETYQGAKLVRVTESGAVLEGAEGTVVLTLFPDVKKTPGKGARKPLSAAGETGPKK